tara:strand:+ start:685 stop:870 length:186 start_codon:yes stop_codon:yes gene_type:complete
MKASRLGTTERSCDSCISWGLDDDKGTFRICLIKDEHVSCSDSCQFYIKKEKIDSEMKGEK